MTLHTLVKREDITRISAILDENGYEGRYEWNSNSSEEGMIKVKIHEDYEDLPGLFEILNSQGIQVLDQYDVDNPLYDSYQLNEKTECKNEEEFIPITIPAHFIQNPIEDQLY